MLELISAHQEVENLNVDIANLQQQLEEKSKQVEI